MKDEIIIAQNYGNYVYENFLVVCSDGYLKIFFKSKTPFKLEFLLPNKDITATQLTTFINTVKSRACNAVDNYNIVANKRRLKNKIKEVINYEFYK